MVSQLIQFVSGDSGKRASRDYIPLIGIELVEKRVFKNTRGVTMKAVWNDRVIAESDDTVFIEGNYYFPMSAVRGSFLEDSDTTGLCGWKGTSNYYHLVVDGVQNENAAWCFPEPKEAAKRIAGRVAFWRGVQVVA
jgi:uncharacterized protein (DUF427 family)